MSRDDRPISRLLWWAAGGNPFTKKPPTVGRARRMAVARIGEQVRREEENALFHEEARLAQEAIDQIKEPLKQRADMTKEDRQQVKTEAKAAQREFNKRYSRGIRAWRRWKRRQARRAAEEGPVLASEGGAGDLPVAGEGAGPSNGVGKKAAVAKKGVVAEEEQEIIPGV